MQQKVGRYSSNGPRSTSEALSSRLVSSRLVSSYRIQLSNSTARRLIASSSTSSVYYCNAFGKDGDSQSFEKEIFLRSLCSNCVSAMSAVVNLGSGPDYEAQEDVVQSAFPSEDRQGS
jgi:hypothetical protein